MDQVVEAHGALSLADRLRKEVDGRIGNATNAAWVARRVYETMGPPPDEADYLDPEVHGELMKLVATPPPPPPTRRVAGFGDVAQGEGLGALGFALGQIFRGRGGDALTALAAPLELAQGRLDARYAGEVQAAKLGQDDRETRTRALQALTTAGLQRFQQAGASHDSRFSKLYDTVVDGELGAAKIAQGQINGARLGDQAVSSAVTRALSVKGSSARRGAVQGVLALYGGRIPEQTRLNLLKAAGVKTENELRADAGVSKALQDVQTARERARLLKDQGERTRALTSVARQQAALLTKQVETWDAEADSKVQYRAFMATQGFQRIGIAARGVDLLSDRLAFDQQLAAQQFTTTQDKQAFYEYAESLQRAQAGIGEEMEALKSQLGTWQKVSEDLTANEDVKKDAREKMAAVADRMKELAGADTLNQRQQDVLRRFAEAARAGTAAYSKTAPFRSVGSPAPTVRPGAKVGYAPLSGAPVVGTIPGKGAPLLRPGEGLSGGKSPRKRK